MIEELKPCPFCGSTNQVFNTWGELNLVSVKCTGCQIETKAFLCKLDLIAMWNTRVETAKLKAEIKELRAEHAKFLKRISEPYTGCETISFGRE